MKIFLSGRRKLPTTLSLWFGDLSTSVYIEEEEIYPRNGEVEDNVKSHSGR